MTGRVVCETQRLAVVHEVLGILANGLRKVVPLWTCTGGVLAFAVANSKGGEGKNGGEENVEELHFVRMVQSRLSGPLLERSQISWSWIAREE